MKAALLGFLSSALLISTLCAQPPKAVPALPPGTSSEQGQTEILKVYAVDDGDAKFRAYVIKHKGNEVVVSDIVARTNHKVGEKIDYVVIKVNGTMQFQVFGFGVPPKKK
jgi:hypothetical protein